MNEVDTFFENANLELAKEQNKLSKAEISAKNDLLTYLSKSIESVQKEDEISELLKSNLVNRLQDPDVVNEIPTGTLLKGLIELEQLKNQREASILEVLKQKGFVINNNLNLAKGIEKDEKPIPKKEPVTKEDFDSAKKIYDFLSNIKEAEINETGEKNNE